jgi:hypothetical protein
MRNPYELLSQKEEELGRVRHEVESLQLVASLLSEGSDPKQEYPAAAEDDTTNDESKATGTEGVFSSLGAPRRKFWMRGKDEQ